MSTFEPAPADPGAPMSSWPTGRLLSTAARLVEQDWLEALAALGLTHAGLIALHLLDGGPLSQAELAREARVTTQTMSRTLERLERQGHVSRTRADDDARRHVVSRTDTGTEVVQKAEAVEAEAIPLGDDPSTLRALLFQLIAARSPV